MDWSVIARTTISKVHEGLSEDVTFAERKKAVDAAYPFGERAYWPYKAWLKARKTYLAKHDPSIPKPSAAPLFADLPRDPITGRPVI